MDSNLGKKLMLFLSFASLTVRGNGLSYPLIIKRPNLVAHGEEVSISCELRGDISKGKCNWRTPQNVSLTADLVTGVVTDSDGQNQDGFAAFTDAEKKVCGLRIASLDKNQHLGEWRCQIDKMRFHRGTFHLLDAKMGHVRDIRIPRHVVPEQYDLSMTPYFQDNNFTVKGHVRNYA